MIYVVIAALLCILFSWIIHAYHRIAHLQLAMQSTWEKSRIAIKERNAALREFTYLLAIHEGQDKILRLLRRTEGDLGINLSHTSPQDKGKEENLQRLQINEEKLQQLLMSLKRDILTQQGISQNNTLLQAYELVLRHNEHRKKCIMMYNETVQLYNRALTLGANRVIAGVFYFRPEKMIHLQ